MNGVSVDESTIKRFERLVIKHDDGCWGWSGTSTHNGYARIFYKNNSVGAHRVSWLIYRGEIAPQSSILHTCDKLICTNPDHLYMAQYGQRSSHIKSNTIANKKMGRKRLHIDIPSELYNYLHEITSNRNCTITKYMLRMIVEKLSCERK